MRSAGRGPDCALNDRIEKSGDTPFSRTLGSRTHVCHGCWDLMPSNSEAFGPLGEVLGGQGLLLNGVGVESRHGYAFKVHEVYYYLAQDLQVE